MAELIRLARSIVPACDVPTLEALDALVEATSDISCVGGYKVGLELALAHGLHQVMSTIRAKTRLPVIYDHQKGGTDIPDIGERFALCCGDAGVDAVILFPLSGPRVLAAWVEACRNRGIEVIVGGEMTHAAYLQSEGGYISDEAPGQIYHLAADLGVTRFVVPGNRPQKIEAYRRALGAEAEFFSPGLVAQGGSITEAGRVAGKRWHAIVGRAIYAAEDVRGAAQQMAAALTEEEHDGG